MRQEHATGLRQLVIASQHAITTSLGTQIINSVAEPSRTHIRLRSANRDECETLLIRRQAAISLTYRIKSEPVSELPSFLTEAIIGSETLIPVCSTDHAGALMAQFHNGTLRIIGYPADVFLGAAVTRYILPAMEGRCAVSVVTETGLSTAALQLSQSGLGVAWVPEALARPALDRGELTDLHNSLGGVNIGACRSKMGNHIEPCDFGCLDAPDHGALNRCVKDRERSEGFIRTNLRSPKKNAPLISRGVCVLAFVEITRTTSVR